MDLAARLQNAWATRGPLAWLLWPAGAIVGALAGHRRARALARPPRRLPVPVIVVGNLVVGGAGKTPVTLALVEALRAQGWQPGVVSRGFGRGDDAIREVQPDDAAAACGDEPLLIRRRARVPVVVGADRVAAARALLAAHPGTDVIVSDDGLQHHALPRDVQLVVFDERGIGNGWCLPAGPLREPLPGQPWPGTLVLYNAAAPTTPWPGPSLERRLAGAMSLADWWADRHDRLRPLAELRDRPALAVAGTARPQRFFDALRAAGLATLDTLPLPDHHRFATLPWPDDTPTVLLTEKDAVKLRPERLAGGRTQVWVVPLVTDLPAGTLAALRAALPPGPDAGRQGRAAG